MSIYEEMLLQLEKKKHEEMNEEELIKEARERALYHVPYPHFLKNIPAGIWRIVRKDKLGYYIRQHDLGTIKLLFVFDFKDGRDTVQIKFRPKWWHDLWGEEE